MFVLPSLRENQSKSRSKRCCLWAVESSGFCGAAPALAPLAGAGDSWAPLLAKPFAAASLSPGASLAEVCFMALKNAKLVFVFLAILNQNFECLNATD